MSRPPVNTQQNESTMPQNFIEEIIEADNASGKHGSRVATRFPPEPNGYLHIGHAKSICLNAGIAAKYGGTFNLRFDDTNPTREETEFVESIIEDVRWLAGDVGERLFFASSYFEQMYLFAEELIRKGKAYVCDLSAEEIRRTRGTPTSHGTNSPYRDRDAKENLDLFRRMRAGEFQDGTKVLRAKVDMASPNLNMRDPVMYRIVHAAHHRTGEAWCLYPMYDWAHGLEDSLEKITHSICTLEFEDHRPLYDWFLANLDGVFRPQQIEFARLNLSYTVMSKRKLRELVETNRVDGWDDPRMPTICGLRRRGYTAESIRSFCRAIGVSKVNSTIDLVVLENSVREELNKTAQRRMAVLRPLKLTIRNYPEGQTEFLDCVNNPENEQDGTRQVPFSRTLWIEQDDFREDAPKKYFRLKPGGEVRLRYAYYVTCVDVVKDGSGNVIEVICDYDPETRGGSSPDGRKVQGTIHWVSASHAVTAEVRLYDRLFGVASPDGDDWLSHLNPQSLEVLPECYLEPSLADATPNTPIQFERLGYFCADSHLVFNRTVSLRDSWAKAE
ncbi:MAG: glutamine--tRNA ligase/YqeY domain fusion protein [Thermoguttaceae bacterium]